MTLATTKPTNASPEAMVSQPQTLTLENLSQYFHLPINDVAKELGICATVLKKICRKNGINRWPHRKIKSIDKMIESLEELTHTNPNDLPSLLSDIETLKEKREFLLKNPNVSYKSVVPKYCINACNARIQKANLPGSSSPNSKNSPKYSPRESSQSPPPRAIPTISLPAPSKAIEKKKMPSLIQTKIPQISVPALVNADNVPDQKSGREFLLNSQDKIAADILLNFANSIRSQNSDFISCNDRCGNNVPSFNSLIALRMSH